jgi:hypothetical protein
MHTCPSRNKDLLLFRTEKPNYLVTGNKWRPDIIAKQKFIVISL